MKRSVATTILIVLLAAPVWAQDKATVPEPKLSEVQRLKADLFKARVEIAQLRATLADRESRLASAELSAEQAKLAAEFLAAFKAPAGSTWDWATMTVKLPEPATKKEN